MSYRWCVLPLIFLAFFVAVGAEQALAADDNNAILTHLGPLAERQAIGGRKLVVIYYGNDISSPSNYNYVWMNLASFTKKIASGSKDLSAEERARATQIGKCVARRYDELSAQTIADLNRLNAAALKKGFLVASVRNRGNNTLVYNNVPRTKLFRELEWTRGPYLKEGEGQVQIIERIRLPHDLGLRRFAWAPLNHPAVFEEVLRQILAKFPDKEYCFVLIVRSPSTRDSMLTDVLTPDVETIEDTALAQATLKSVARMDLTKLGDERVAMLVNQALVDAFVIPGLAERKRELRETKGLFADIPHFLPDYVPRVMQSYEFGTTKLEFMTSLNELGAGQYPGFFPLVILAGARSRLEFSSEPDLTEVLATTPGSYEGFRMRHVDTIFAQGDAPIDVSSVIDQSLRRAVRDPSLDFLSALRDGLAESVLAAEQPGPSP